MATTKQDQHQDPHQATTGATATHEAPAAHAADTHPAAAVHAEDAKETATTDAAKAKAAAPYVVPKTLAGGKAEIELEIRHTAGGDVNFLVTRVVNAVSPAPGEILTQDQLDAISGAGWKVSAVASGATAPTQDAPI